MCFNVLQGDLDASILVTVFLDALIGMALIALLSLFANQIRGPNDKTVRTFRAFLFFVFVLKMEKCCGLQNDSVLGRLRTGIHSQRLEWVKTVLNYKIGRIPPPGVPIDMTGRRGFNMITRQAIHRASS